MRGSCVSGDVGVERGCGDVLRMGLSVDLWGTCRELVGCVLGSSLGGGRSMARVGSCGGAAGGS